MTGTNCTACGNEIKVGQTIIGMPVIRIVAAGQSKMAGTEILFHVTCFVEKMAKPKVEIIKAI